MSLNTYYFDGNDAITDPNSKWIDDAKAFDHDPSTYAYPSDTGESNYLLGEGTNAPTSGPPITSVRVRAYGNSTDGFSSNTTRNEYRIYTDGLGELLGSMTIAPSSPLAWSDWTTLSVPTGGWTWEKVSLLECKTWGTNPNSYPGAMFSVGKVELEVFPVRPGNMLHILK